MFSLNITFLAEIIIFLIIIRFVRKNIVPRIDQVIRERQSKIQQHLREIEMSKDILNNTHIEAKNLLKKSQVNARELINEARFSIADLQVKMKKEYEQEVIEINLAIETRSKKEIESYKEEAKKEVMLHACQIASKILQRNITPEDQQKILEKIINEIDQ